MPARTSSKLLPRLRVLCQDEIALGPGKVDLLALIHQTGSIREAAEKMGMSYMRAWKLIRTMNKCFKQPVVQAVRGGPAHGGASLTSVGLDALSLYQKMQADSLKATRADWRKLQSLLR